MEKIGWKLLMLLTATSILLTVSVSADEPIEGTFLPIPQGNLIIYGSIPTNGSTACVMISNWSVIIETTNGTFNWSIDTCPYVGNSSQSGDTNGTKNVTLSTPLAFDTNYTVYVNATGGGNVRNSTFWFVTGSNSVPIISNEDPINESTGVLLSINYWNCTVEDPDGVDNLTVNITCSNSDTVEYNSYANGTFNLSLLSGLDYETNYTIWVNTTDGTAWTNETFWFYTEEGCPVVTAEYPTNGSTGVEIYPYLHITVSDPRGYNFDINWTSNSSWISFGTNTSCTNGTYYQRALADQPLTKYYWNVSVNNSIGKWTNVSYSFTTDTYSLGNWSAWWIFNYSSDSPTNFVATAYNKTQINLTWVNGVNGADATVIVRNESGWVGTPTSPTNGTEIYNSTGTSYEDSGLVAGTQYCYSAWSWNTTEDNHSIAYVSDCTTIQSNLAISSEYPINHTTEESRPPTNLSAFVEGSAIDIYIYFYNMTSISDTWTLVASWIGQTDGRFEAINLASFGRTTEFKWGNTTYTWSVNITDGNQWLNYTYWYVTQSSISGESARYDTNIDLTNIDVLDLSTTWGRRTFDDTWIYDELYDVNTDDNVNVLDLSSIWGHKTI